MLKILLSFVLGMLLIYVASILPNSPLLRIEWLPVLNNQQKGTIEEVKEISTDDSEKKPTKPAPPEPQNQEAVAPDSVPSPSKEVNPSILSFTDAKGTVIGQLAFGKTISFTGSLEPSGALFMSYIMKNMSLNCDWSGKDYPSPTPQK